MEGREGTVWLPLTNEEAQELFTRLLKAHDEDNPTSAALICRLAKIMAGEPLSMACRA